MQAMISQLWDNFMFFLVVGLFIELAISAIFSIRVIDDFLNTTLLRSIKNALVIIASFGICAKIDSLRFFYGTKLAMPETVHYILSSLVLARMANLVHEFINYIKARSKAV
ncbi:MAG: hypothetical protein J0L53_10175 [Spirochaetes bacterium]|nr:hypothetical protein [Spirochaetota bacterium]MBX3720919.1 hypothetical protein [Turneriella sp.]